MPKKLTDLPQNVTAYVMSDYLSEKDKSALIATSKKTQGLFQPPRMQEMANKLLLQVMRGEHEKAEIILKHRPELLIMTGTATDYSGRMFATTAFRYALWALDTRYMCNMMLDCLPKSEQGEAITQGLLAQFNAQVQDGLDYELNGMTIHEAHYDFLPIKAALKTYVNEYDNWCEHNSVDAMRNQWSKVVGLAQRYFPAHVAQHYCDPDETLLQTPTFNKKTFKRSLEFNNFNSSARKFWYAAVSSTDGLGVNFGIGRSLGAASEWDWVGMQFLCMAAKRDASFDLAALTALCEVRTADLFPLKQRLEGPIQKPDSVPDLPWCVIS